MLAALAWTVLALAANLPESRVAISRQAIMPARVSQSSQANSSIGPFQVTGRVVDSLTGAPVAGAIVVIAETRTRLNRTVRAGTNGSFAFTQMPAGHYLMVARRKGYIEQMYLQHEQFTSAIEVGPNLNSENLVYPLPPQCVLSGQVTDELGDPVEGAKALLFAISTEDGRHENRLKSQRITDEEGRYRFEALPAGDYYLAISAEPWYARAARWGGVFQSSADSVNGQKPKESTAALDVVYPITYYPSATDPAAAALIHIESGGSTQADVRLVAVPALHVRLNPGKVESGSSIDVNVSQKIFGSYDDNFWASHQFGSVGDSPGEEASEDFEHTFIDLDGLRPGATYIDVTTRTGRAQSQSGPTKSVRIDPKDGQTLELGEIVPVATITGILRTESSAAPPGARVTLRETSRGSSLRAQADASGSFRITAEHADPGVYRIFATAPGGWQLKSASATGAKVIGHDVEIGDGADVQLTLALARGVDARLQGMLLHDGKPAVGMMVILVPQNLESSVDFRRDQSNSDGSFSLNQILPGRYTIVAVKDWSLEWTKPEVIRPYLASGTPVEVAGGEERHIEVTVK